MSTAAIRDRVFAALEAAAASGARCPVREQLPGANTIVGELAREGRIFVEVFVHNFRRVTILTGPHKGKATANPPLRDGRPPKPYLTVGLATKRNGAVVVSKNYTQPTMKFRDGRRIA